LTELFREDFLFILVALSSLSKRTKHRHHGWLDLVVDENGTANSRVQELVFGLGNVENVLQLMVI
jgi:hypothetical protein